jgi:hypothetical protein
MVYIILSPEETEPSDHELEPLKPRAKINLSSINMFLSGICTTKKKVYTVKNISPKMDK